MELSTHGVRALPADFEGVPLTVYLVEGALIDSGVAGTPARLDVAADTVIHTHAHHDHVGGDAELDARVIAPRAEAAWVESPDRYYEEMYGSGPWRPPPEHEARVRRLRGAGVRVDERIDPGDAVPLPSGRALQAIPTPGHSPGHLAFLHADAGVLFCGDAIIGRGTRLEAGRMFPLYIDVDAYLASLDRVEAAGARIACTAHDGVLDAAGLAVALDESRRFVAELDTAVRELSPGPLEDVVARLIERWPEYKASFAAHQTVAAHLAREEETCVQQP